MSVTRKTLWFIALLWLHLSASASLTCEDGHPFKTPAGPLTITTCSDPKAGTVKYAMRVGPMLVLEDSFLGFEDRDSQRLHWIFVGGPLHETGCPRALYFLDLSESRPKVTALGVRGACNRFHWASWGKRSVVAIKNNVRFTFEDGKFLLPAPGEQLWRSVAPPEAGKGLAEENAIPFAEDVPLPK